MGILVDDIGDRVVLPILPNGVDFVPREFYKLQNKLLQLNSKFGKCNKHVKKYLHKILRYFQVMTLKLLNILEVWPILYPVQ